LIASHVFNFFQVKDKNIIESLEYYFSCDFVRKLFAVSEDSDFRTGLECFLDKDIQVILQSMKSIINNFYTDDIDSALKLAESQIKFQLSPFLYDVFLNHLIMLKKDPLLHLKWRIESFVKIDKDSKNFNFAINSSNERDKLTNKLLGFSILFLPEQEFFNMTPVSISSLFKCLNRNDETISFIRQLIFEKDSFTRKELETVLIFVLNCQFIYETRKSSRVLLYGLSQSALLAIKPYLKIILSILK
jgi:hypothetical protein